MKTFLQRLARGVVTLLLVAVTAASTAYLVPGLFGYERYVITGGSMSGTFEKGAVAFEEQVPVADLAVGDVITYVPPADSGVSTLVTHRISSIEPGPEGERVFRTKGDANTDVDPWNFSLVEETQPVVRFTVPHVGFFFIALSDPQIRVFLIGVPAGLIALLALRDLVVALLPRRGRATGSTPRPASTPSAAAPRTA